MRTLAYRDSGLDRDFRDFQGHGTFNRDNDQGQGLLGTVVFRDRDQGHLLTFRDYGFRDRDRDIISMLYDGTGTMGHLNYK